MNHDQHSILAIPAIPGQPIGHEVVRVHFSASNSEIWTGQLVAENPVYITIIRDPDNVTMRLPWRDIRLVETVAYIR